MRIKFQLCTVGIAVALFAAGCSKKSSSPTAPQNTAPAFPSVTIKGPSTSSSDAHAQTAVAYTTEVNALTNSGLFGAFAGMNGTQTGSTWTWVVTEGTLSVTFTEAQQADGSYTWSWKENGTNSQTNVVYNNWVFFSGNRSADGRNGEWKVFNDDATTLAGDFTWATNASNVLSATLLSYNTSGSLTGKIAVTNNHADNSGEVDYYVGTVMTFKATWTSTGAGTWWTYDSGTGTQTGTGTWS